MRKKKKKKKTTNPLRTSRVTIGKTEGIQVELPGDRGFFWMADDSPPELGLAWLEKVLREEPSADEG